MYEWSVVVGLTNGIVKTVSSRLNEILSNASYDDSMTARVLRARFLVSQTQYKDATKGILDVLSSLGEDFPEEINEEAVSRDINAIIPILDGVTTEKILGLPTLTDKTKLNAMKFMDLLTTFILNISSPLLMHLVACRMIKLTFEVSEDRARSHIIAYVSLNHFVGSFYPVRVQC